MKQLFLLLIFVSSFIFAQNNCQYSVEIKSNDLKSTGFFFLSIKNIGNESFKIPKKINLCNMRLEDLEFLNKENGRFEKMKLANKDIDCFKLEKEKNLKPNKVYTYKVDLKSDFSVIESDGFFKTFNDRTYRFKLSFALDGYRKCNKALITNWIYKN